MKDIRSLTFALAVAAIALAVANPAAAEQGCSDGYKPTPTQNGIECRPIPGLYKGSGGGAAPQVRWEERWGAIVMDAASGMTGIGGGQRTEEAAIQSATAMCQRKGGKNCRVDITYSNQCGALAWGSNHAVSARGRTLEIASKYAIDACEKTTGKKCEVFFSDCSLPVRVQ
ncbi:DUF4189 domain-containing protein [Achromobacter sp. Marseille-Q0513]|uniref:DUF4189 domain-containing protein n=1 Tax=Achromobacter sp. Marseille-Q0513 TaxID=2829161 RepID=UPI001B98511D|nr:DUF4189 domain-containing protein [Achromobacter sp. Marseille-Q0513]MBR8652113.1 DUF4189 domain-containing protein [Achromobacter sp. Marseille-Q0513]